MSAPRYRVPVTTRAERLTWLLVASLARVCLADIPLPPDQAVTVSVDPKGGAGPCRVTGRVLATKPELVRLELSSVVRLHERVSLLIPRPSAIAVQPNGDFEVPLAGPFPMRLSAQAEGNQPISFDVGSCGLHLRFLVDEPYPWKLRLYAPAPLLTESSVVVSVLPPLLTLPRRATVLKIWWGEGLVEPNPTPLVLPLIFEPGPFPLTNVDERDFPIAYGMLVESFTLLTPGISVLYEPDVMVICAAEGVMVEGAGVLIDCYESTTP